MFWHVFYTNQQSLIKPMLPVTRGAYCHSTCIMSFRTHYPRRRFGGSGGAKPPARRWDGGAAGAQMISAVSANLEFTSWANCLTARSQFKLGLPGYENIFTSGLRFKLGLQGYDFPVTSRLLSTGQ